MIRIRFLPVASLLLLGQPLSAGDRGGGVGFALPTPQAASRALPAAPAIRTQRNHPRIASQTGGTIQGSDLPQTRTVAIAADRPIQNQRRNDRLNFSQAKRRALHEMHDHDWWRKHFQIIVFAIGGFYYCDSGYWYPAWGYDPSYNNYDYDGPIYAYGNLMPDQVVANVQTALNEEGYYSGPINGSLNSATQAAIANYQRDNGLEVTGAVDEPTVESLGLE